MDSLIDFSFLEFSNDFHIFFGDRIFFEIFELGGIVRKIQQINFALMFLIKLLDKSLDIQVIPINNFINT